MDLSTLFNAKLYNAVKAHKDHDDREPLARYIEEGGDLSDLSGEEREIFAQFVRTGKRRAREKVPEIERNRKICERLAYLGGFGYKKTEAFKTVAQEFGMSVDSIKRTIWPKRRKFSGNLHGQHIIGQVDKTLELMEHHVKKRLEHEETYGGLRPSITVADIFDGLPDWSDEYYPDTLADGIHDAIIKHGWIVQEQDGEVRYKPGI